MPTQIGDIFRVVLKGTWQSQQWVHVWHNRCTDESTDTVITELPISWWNTYKQQYRELVINSANFAFQEVTVDALQGAREFAVYAIPAGEQAGVRTGVTGEFMPSFVAAGVRFNVPNRLTRPGQKRLPGLLEVDVVQNVLETAYRGFVTLWADKMVTPWETTAGDKSAFRPGVLMPDLFGQGQPGINQFTSATVNPRVTSQISRKLGIGR